MGRPALAQQRRDIERAPDVPARHDVGEGVVVDVQMIINEALGAIPGVHDLNHDGVVNVADVQKVINAALGLGCPY